MSRWLSSSNYARLLWQGFVFRATVYPNKIAFKGKFYLRFVFSTNYLIKCITNFKFIQTKVIDF